MHHENANCNSDLLHHSAILPFPIFQIIVAIIRPENRAGEDSNEK